MKSTSKRRKNMGANPKVSVIVPVYNAGKFLSKCVDSLLAQKYEYVEIILVEDGSKDDSARICDEYANKSNKVKVIHKENAGASAARNTGILNATGEYISFCDADDTLESDCYANIVPKMAAEDADVAYFGWSVDVVNGKRVTSTTQTDNGMTGVGNQDDIFRTMLTMCGAGGGKTSYGNYIWNKIYKTEKIKDKDGNFILFDETVKVAEDGLWLVNAGQNWHKGIFDNKAYYHYLKNDESVMNTKENFAKTRLESQDSHKKMLNILKDFNESYYEIHKQTCIDYFWIVAKGNPETKTEEFFRQVVTNIIEINDGQCPSNIAKDCLWHMRQTQINRRLLNNKIVKVAVDFVKKKEKKKSKKK